MLPNFPQFTKDLRTWDFLSPIDFIFSQIVKIVFQVQYICREKGIFISVSV